MSRLTADQIAFGSKAKMTPLSPPKPEQVGRWRCHLCPWPRWVRGTYGEWMEHWMRHEEGLDAVGEA